MTCQGSYREGGAVRVPPDIALSLDSQPGGWIDEKFASLSHQAEQRVGTLDLHDGRNSRDNLRQDGHRHVPRVFPTIQLVRRREGGGGEITLNLISSRIS